MIVCSIYYTGTTAFIIKFRVQSWPILVCVMLIISIFYLQKENLIQCSKSVFLICQINGKFTP